MKYVSLQAITSRQAHALSQFLVQAYTGLMYNHFHAPYADIPNQPSQAPPTVSANDPVPASATTTAAPQLRKQPVITVQPRLCLPP